MAQNYGLGRGLSSLIPQKKTKTNASTDDLFPKKEENKKAMDARFDNLQSKIVDDKKSEHTIIEKASATGDLMVAIDNIATNPFQPRFDFDKEKLAELANSIKIHGVIQPLVVSKKGDKFELIAGERRLQASKLAELKEVPVVVRNIKDKQKLELAIIENVQRHNLNPIEEAKAYQRLMDEFGLNQEQVAEKMGKSRSLVANKIRLLGLSIEAVKALNEGKITEGHAKAILSLKNAEKQRALLELIIKNQLTVRQAENKTKDVLVKAHRRQVTIDPEIQALENSFSSALGTKVKVKQAGGSGGRIIIDYYSPEELTGIKNKIIDKSM